MVSRDRARNERKAVFRDDRDRRRFLDLLQDWVNRFGIRLHAYVLMDNHYHLLLESTNANLAQAMQWLQVSYTVWFNRRHRRIGHLFQGRYKAILLEPTAAAWEVSRYVHLNPVRIQGLGLGKTERERERVGLTARRMLARCESGCNGCVSIDGVPIGDTLGLRMCRSGSRPKRFCAKRAKGPGNKGRRPTGGMLNWR